MFILLLFFIVTSSFRDPNDAALDIILPKSNATSAENKSSESTLFIDKTGLISFEGKKLSIKDFKSQFKTLYTDTTKTILLKGDEEVSYQMFISVFDILKEHNIDKLILATKGNQFKK